MMMMMMMMMIFFKEDPRRWSIMGPIDKNERGRLKNTDSQHFFFSVDPRPTLSTNKTISWKNTAGRVAILCPAVWVCDVMNKVGVCDKTEPAFFLFFVW